MRLEAIIDTVLDGIITIDERGTIETINVAIERLFGYGVAELIGQNVKMLMPNSYAREHDGYLSNYLRTGTRKIIGIGREVEGLRKDGTTFPLELAVNEMRVGGTRRFVGILRDVTDRKEAEQRLRDSEERVRENLQRTTTTVAKFSELIGKIAEGDLTRRLQIDDSDDSDLGVLGQHLNAMTENLASISGQIEGFSSKIVSAVEQIGTATTQQAAAASEQSSSVQQTTTTLEELRASTQQTQEAVKHLGDSAERASSDVDLGKQSVAEVIAGMNKIREQMEGIAQTILALSERTQQIGEITNAVTRIAQQSKMLALNASIEAAKAGEAGKGFAVVATEVKDLAEQSEEATAKVQEILQDIRHATDRAVMAAEEGTKEVDAGGELVQRMGELVDQLSAVVQETSRTATQVVVAVREGTAGIDQVNAAMREINEGASQTAASTEQLATVSRALHESAIELGNSVRKYRLA